MDTSALIGCATAIVTPFHADGSVDDASLRSFVEWQITSGIKLLVACGSTGEASTLSDEETLRVARTVIETAKGRATVFVGCTHNSTSEAVRRAKEIAKLPGIGGILSACPYYNKPSQEGLYLHFKAIAEAVAPLPVLLYNIPGRTASNLEPATVARLAKIENVIGIKESSGNIVQIAETIAVTPKDFHVFSGDDPFALASISAGAIGLVSVLSNVAPELAVKMVEAALSGDMVTARRISHDTAKLVKELFAEPSPGPVKAVLARMGKIESEALRLPMTPISPAHREKIMATVGELGLLTTTAAR